MDIGARASAVGGAADEVGDEHGPAGVPQRPCESRRARLSATPAPVTTASHHLWPALGQRSTNVQTHWRGGLSCNPRYTLHHSLDGMVRPLRLTAYRGVVRADGFCMRSFKHAPATHRRAVILSLTKGPSRLREGPPRGGRRTSVDASRTDGPKGASPEPRLTPRTAFDHRLTIV